MTMTTHSMILPRPAAPLPATPPTAAPRPASHISSGPRTICLQNREASLNWLAFGLLLAAWNAAGDDAANARVRPDALRGYSSVSVRAAQRHKSFNEL